MSRGPSNSADPAFTSAIGRMVWLLVDMPQPRLTQMPEIGGEVGLGSVTPEVGVMAAAVAMKL